VVRLDDRSPPVDFDDAARQRLARALDREGVLAAHLFGSQATGDPGPLSDVDVAVWLHPGLGDELRLRLRLGLQDAAIRAVGHDSVDVVALNDAPPPLCHRVIRDKQTLVDRDPATRAELEAWAILEYLDTEPLRAELARGLRDRLAEDRFGRR